MERREEKKKHNKKPKERYTSIQTEWKLLGGLRMRFIQFLILIFSDTTNTVWHDSSTEFDRRIVYNCFYRVFSIEFTTQNTNFYVVRTSNYARETQSLLTSILFFFLFLFHYMHARTHKHTVFHCQKGLKRNLLVMFWFLCDSSEVSPWTHQSQTLLCLARVLWLNEVHSIQLKIGATECEGWIRIRIYSLRERLMQFIGVWRAFSCHFGEIKHSEIFQKSSYFIEISN